MAKTENRFPTIRDLRDRLSELVEQGLGDQPVQVLVVPDSTIQVIAQAIGPASEKPALMIELAGDDTGRLPAALISTERLMGNGGMKSLTRQ